MTLPPAGLLTRLISSILALLLWAPQPAFAQMGFDRPGGDYAHVMINSRDPADCAMQCEGDRRCRAWSFTFPNDPRAAATCWLKNTLPQRLASNCCVSGVRGAGVLEPLSGAFEMFTNRLGGDYRSFDVTTANGDHASQSACTGDARCRAWTYAWPGYAGHNARCFLKSDIKPPRRAPGFTSGVVR